MMKQYFADHPEIHHCIISDVWKGPSGRHWLGSQLFQFLSVLSPFTFILGISTQFATEDMKIFAPSIAVCEIHDRHTIENLGEILEQVCEKWGIVPSLSVTDSASNALGSSQKLVDSAEARFLRTR